MDIKHTVLETNSCTRTLPLFCGVLGSAFISVRFMSTDCTESMSAEAQTMAATGKVLEWSWFYIIHTTCDPIIQV